MRVLWAVSSVGLGHVMRDLAVVERLERSGVQVDWLAPAPAGDFLRRRGCTVLPESDRLKGSGQVYARVFSGRTDFNLMAYVSADTRLHRQDFLASAGAWRRAAYSVAVGDEAFWLLTGFSMRWSPKPAPFVFLTDFIGTRAMTPGWSERWTSLAIPLDHHFEQEDYMAHRLRHHGVGRVVTLRDHTPESITAMAEAMIGRPVPRIAADDGSEIAEIVRQAAREPPRCDNQ